MFKLGADWHGNVENQKMVSLGKANDLVKNIPGTVLVDPETGVVRLGHPPRMRPPPPIDWRPSYYIAFKEYLLAKSSVRQEKSAQGAEKQPLQGDGA